MFFYIKPNSRYQKEFIYAIKFKGELHICQFQSFIKDTDKKFESFIYGVGHKSAKQVVKVPTFKGQLKPSELKKYLDTYGKEFLFYSLTGYELSSQDCVCTPMIHEFNSSIMSSFEEVESFVKGINSMNERVRRVLLDKYKVDIFSENTFQYVGGEGGKLIFTKDLFRFKPSYTMMAYFVTAPTVDVIIDDYRIEQHYKYIGDFKKELPVQMKARLEFLFGKDIAIDYEKLFNKK